MNEMVYNINSLDGSDGRVKGYDLKVESSQLLEKEFYRRGEANPQL